MGDEQQAKRNKRPFSAVPVGSPAFTVLQRRVGDPDAYERVLKGWRHCEAELINMEQPGLFAFPSKTRPKKTQGELNILRENNERAIDECLAQATP
jgi:hypothetical protein